MKALHEMYARSTARLSPVNLQTLSNVFVVSVLYERRDFSPISNTILGAVKNVLLPAVGAFSSNLIGNAVDDDPLHYGEVAGGAILDAAFHFLPTKFLKQKLNKSKS